MAIFKNRIESISSTSSAPCRFTIPVNISATDDYTIETDIRWISYPDSLNIEGVANISGNWYGVTNAGIYTITPASTTSCSTDKFDNIRFAVQGSTTTLYVNGTQAISKTNQRADLTSIPLYWSYYSGSYYNMFVERKYFSLKVNGEYVHYYIPVLDNNDVPCFYDTVTNTLLYADEGYTPQVYGGVISETPSTYQRQKQLLIADKGILPYYCELEYISYPGRYEYTLTTTATDVVEVETEISLNSLPGSTQLELNGGASLWYGVDAQGYYNLGGGILSTEQMPLNTWVKIRDVQDGVAGTNTLYVNGTQILQRGGLIFGTTLTQGIMGGVSNTSYTFDIKKKYHRVIINGKVVHDYIPVLDYNGVACWYDKVSKEFLYAWNNNPTVWGKEIHPIERIHCNKNYYYNIVNFLNFDDTLGCKVLIESDSSGNASNVFLGASNGVNAFTITYNQNGNLVYRWFSTTFQYTTGLAQFDKVDEIEFNKSHIVVNGTEATNVTSDLTTLDNCRLLGANNTSAMLGWLYNCWVKDQFGAYKMYLIPFVDETGTAGLFDTVTRTILEKYASGVPTYDDIELDSIENKVLTDGDTGGPYISLPYEANNNTQIACRFKIKNTSTGRYMYGNIQYRMSHSASTFSITYGPGYYKSVVANPINVIRVKRDSTKNYLNDVEVESNDERNPFTTTSFSIFTQGSSNNGMVGPYNYFQIGENNQLLYDLVPTLRNGVIGMVNTIDGTMYPNLRAGVDFYPNFLPQRKMFDPYAQIDYFSITIDLRRIVNNYSYDFVNNYAGTNDNYVVDWGDGVIEKGGTSHTYAEAKEYEVKFIPLTDSFTWLRFSTGQSTKSQCLISVNKPYPKMPTTIYDVPNWFTGCTNLVSICEDFLQNNRHITNLASIFYTCSKLPAIGKNFFKGMTKLRALSYAFRDTKLAKIPAGLLDDCNDLRIVEHMFANTPITSIPAGLFDNISKSSTMSFAVIFFGTNITSVPQGLFDGFTNVTSISRIFNNCQQLETLPDLLFKDMRNLKNISYAFTYCNALQFNANLFCNEATDMATHFTNSDLDFSGAFNRTTWTGTIQGTAPQLWNYTISGTPTTTGCFGGAGNNATSLTNFASIPSAWGGPAE